MRVVEVHQDQQHKDQQLKDQPPKDQPPNHQQMIVYLPIGIKIIGVMMKITSLLAIGMVEIVVVLNAWMEYAIAVIQTLEA